VATLACCNIQVKQHYCTMLATATGNCAVTNVTYNKNKYTVVTWTVYLQSSMYLRRRQQCCQMCYFSAKIGYFFICVWRVADYLAIFEIFWRKICRIFVQGLDQCLLHNKLVKIVT